MAIIKRDGTREPYSEQKMDSFLKWLRSDTTVNPKMLANELNIPMKDVPVDQLLHDIEHTAEQMANRINLDFFTVSGRALSLSLLKQHRAKGFDLLKPDVRSCASFLATQIYTFEEEMVDDTATKDSWNLLFSKFYQYVIKDYDLPINNVRLVTGRQSKEYNGIKETVAMCMLRQAVAASEYETGKFDVAHATRMFIALHEAAFTLATPMARQAGNKLRVTGSCTLLTIDDSTDGITSANRELAIHSKFGSGNGIDVSLIAGAGRPIKSTGGHSSGVKPFLRVSEAVLAAWNQGGSRPGAGVVTFPWWHIDCEELVFLKNNKGLAEERIRGLKYAMTTNEYFYDACEKGLEVILVCPSVAKEFFGDDRLVNDPLDFWPNYLELLNAHELNCLEAKKIPARTVMKWYLQNAGDNGHVYETNLTNANKQNILNQPVLSSNLCTEVFIPSSRNSDTGETQTGLCYLSSPNIDWYYHASKEDRYQLISDVVRTLDNQIETDHYPVPYSTKDYAKNSRFIGIGMSNLATLFARLDIRWDSQEALELMDEVMDDFSYDVIRASVELAKERGPAPNWKDSKWSEGDVPYTLCNPVAASLTTYTPDTDRWDDLIHDITTYGIRNMLTMALAPTAASGSAAGNTEGIDPVRSLMISRTSTPPVRASVSMDRSILSNYDLAFDIPNEALIKLAAVRQKWIDQGQSVSLYAKGQSFSTKEAYEERALANKLGLKSIYYVKFQKEGDEPSCDSCT